MYINYKYKSISDLACVCVRAGVCVCTCIFSDIHVDIDLEIDVLNMHTHGYALHIWYIFFADIYICVCVRIYLSWMSFACLGTPETVPPEIVAITEPAWYICIHHLPRTARYCKVLSWAKMFVTHQSWFVDIGTSVRDACTLTNV